MPTIQRQTRRQADAAITASASTTAEVDITDATSGTVFVPSGSSLTTLTFHVAPVLGGTYLAAYDDAATPAALALTNLGASKAYAIPAKVFGAAAFKMVGNTTGTVDISLKS